MINHRYQKLHLYLLVQSAVFMVAVSNGRVAALSRGHGVRQVVPVGGHAERVRPLAEAGELVPHGAPRLLRVAVRLGPVLCAGSKEARHQRPMAAARACQLVALTVLGLTPKRRPPLAAS